MAQRKLPTTPKAYLNLLTARDDKRAYTLRCNRMEITYSMGYFMYLCSRPLNHPHALSQIHIKVHSHERGPVTLPEGFVNRGGNTWFEVGYRSNKRLFKTKNVVIANSPNAKTTTSMLYEVTMDLSDERYAVLRCALLKAPPETRLVLIAKANRLPTRCTEGRWVNVVERAEMELFFNGTESTTSGHRCDNDQPCVDITIDGTRSSSTDANSHPECLNRIYMRAQHDDFARNLPDRGYATGVDSPCQPPSRSHQ